MPNWFTSLCQYIEFSVFLVTAYINFPSSCDDGCCGPHRMQTNFFISFSANFRCVLTCKMVSSPHADRVDKINQPSFQKGKAWPKVNQTFLYIKRIIKRRLPGWTTFIKLGQIIKCSSMANKHDLKNLS